MNQTAVKSTIVLWMMSLSILPAQSPTWRTLGATATGPVQSSFGDELVFDAARGVCVRYGTSRQTWEFDGTLWTAGPQGPAAGSFSTVYDSLRQRILVVVVTSGAFETWTYDGVAWSQIAAQGAPPRWSGIAMAYDSARDRVVMLISDVASFGTPATATWEFDGATWVQRTSGGAPPRSMFDIDYDPIRGRTVLFGGFTGSMVLGDTWEWDGRSWIECFGVASPAARRGAQIAWHPLRQRNVLFGGDDGRGNRFDDTWEWDGSTWTLLTPANSPGARTLAGLCYDSQRSQITLYGGGDSADRQTWALTYSTALAGTFAAFGSGCASVAGVPQLSPINGDLPYVNELFELEMTNVGATVLGAYFGIVGFSSTSWQGIPLPVDLGVIGNPGCNLYTAIEVTTSLQRSGNRVVWPIQVPNQPSLGGLQFFVQGIVIDPTGLVVSNAGDARIGLR